jgi:2-polyprenyl-6-methoxyphenol hydroxylase-like FAD-dependent oxidoreductase
MRVLISGASIAGPVLAYWLNRYGFSVTVVERAPQLRKTGGHAVDLFRPAMDIVERMGLMPEVQAKVTGTDHVTGYKEHSGRPVEVNLGNVYGAFSDRHVEIMRDDLSEVFYVATRDDVEYLFGDSIAAISENGEVTFEHGGSRRFDVVVGADGLHSNVRRLVFGDESRLTSFLGAYVAVLSMPNYLGLDDRMLGYLGVGRLAGAYSARHMGDARALFLFRGERPLDYHYRDVPRQKELLRQAFAGMGGEVARWLDELDRTPAFYFDSITQLRMDTWSRGRVTLVGDAGYCPGPVVGASTSLAVVGAYVLAGELAGATGDHQRAFPAYEEEMGDYVRRSRRFAVGVARWLIPTSGAQVWAIFQAARLLSHLPTRLTSRLARLNTRGVRLHDSVVLKDYSARS